MSSPLERRQILIEPEYLIEVSNNVDKLNHFFDLEGMGTLSNDYRNVLVASFTILNQKLQIYSSESVNASCMAQASIISCKATLDLFCLQKLGELLSKESEDLGNIVLGVMKNYQQNMEDFDKVLQAERRMRTEETEGDKDRVINKLREELIYRKDYIAEIKARLEQVEAENIKMYQQTIDRAKNLSSRALSPSPKKHILATNQSIVKIRAEINHGPSKSLSAKQVEETVYDIMETKQKQEGVKGKRVSLDAYLKTYFRNKFGVRELADESETIFREAVEYFAEAEERSVLILFVEMVRERCEEAYFWKQQSFNERITKTLKQHLHRNYSYPLDDLDKFYEGKIAQDSKDYLLNEKDVQYLLVTIYKTTEIESLQLIFEERILPKLQLEETPERGEELCMPSKRVLNQILNYELSRHLLQIEDANRLIQGIETDTRRGYITSEQLQSIIVRLKIPQEKISSSPQILGGIRNRFLTFSEAIETIEKVRKVKPKK